MSQSDDCYSYVHKKCLSFLDSDTVDNIFAKQCDEHMDEFYCLYDAWVAASQMFGENLSLEKLKKANVCPPFWDGLLCSSLTVNNKAVELACPTGHNGTALRYCEDGSWKHTDYSQCNLTDALLSTVESYNNAACPTEEVTTNVPAMDLNAALIIRDIYFFGSIASIVLLTIALLIFSFFKTLQCPRVHIHKNLMLSLLLQSILHIIIFEPYINYHEPTEAYYDIGWLCKTLMTLNNYFVMTNMFWAFVEGLFLFSRISIAVFSTDTPYYLFHLYGWGVPAVFTLIWVVCMQVLQDEQECWQNFGKTAYFWIIATPVVLAVLANLVFLVCIIRILVTKLHAVHSAEHIQIRKATKATIVLLPLLSITSLFFFWEPDIKTSVTAHSAYRITNACLQVAQGMFVSVLFCYFNGEVRSALMKYWKKCRKGAFRYRTSRASSVCVTQSEHLAAMGNPRRQSFSSHLSTENPTTTAVAV